jgi:hypothetical protein
MNYAFAQPCCGPSSRQGVDDTVKYAVDVSGGVARFAEAKLQCLRWRIRPWSKVGFDIGTEFECGIERKL